MLVVNSISYQNIYEFLLYEWLSPILLYYNLLINMFRITIIYYERETYVDLLANPNYTLYNFENKLGALNVEI